MMTSDSQTLRDRNEGIQIPGQWYSIDFHVHSSASRCFEGPEGEDDDDAYFWLLEKAQDAELDVIVVTDHNTISGYESLLELRAELESTRRTLLRNEVAIPDTIQRQIELFDQIIILPGVELDADPNVHLLVLFDPLTSLDSIDEFLTHAGYPEDIRGDESVSRYAKWNCQDVCREAAKMEAVVIAAHVDSDKGLYEASKKWGQKRITAFTDENLFGMEFLNPKTRDQIQSLLKQPDYERDTHLSFVQSSDFHGCSGNRLGERRTYIRLDDVTKSPSEVFQALKRALRNPAEYVSAPGRPEIREIQKRLDDAPSIESLDTDAEVEKLHQYVCAFSNSEDGTIVIGRNKKGNWTGVQCKDKEKIGSQIVALVQEGVSPPPSFELEVYPYYGDKVFVTVRVHRQSEICSTVTDDRVYTIAMNELSKATTAEVVQLAEDKMLERYEHLSITHRLRQVSQELGGTRDSLDILPLVRKIELQTKVFSRLFPPPRYGAVMTPDLEDLIDFRSNGVIDGQIIRLDVVPPRLRDQYIRITAPMGECDLKEPALDDLTRFSGSKILIAPGGAVYLDSHDEIGIVCDNAKPLVCQPGEDYIGPDLAFVAAYLKSAIAIWYADRCFRSTDIRDMNQVLRNLPVPYDPPPHYEQDVLNLVDQLVKLEHKFLAAEESALEEIQALDAETGDDNDHSLIRKKLKETMEATDKHNKEADKLMSELESVFFELLNLTDEEIEIVEQGIGTADFMVFR